MESDGNLKQIRFKAERRLHDSGYRVMEKSGDLEYDHRAEDSDVIDIRTKGPTSIRIDCEKNGTYRVFFDGDELKQEEVFKS